MKTCLIPLLVVLAVAVVLLSCGTSKHMLMSVNISPATADAADYSNSQVPFVANAVYSTNPSPVTPFSATWGACDILGNPTTDVTVSSAGLAQCSSSASGTFTVWAFGTVDLGGMCGAQNACGFGCGRVTGTAMLTCP